MDKPATYLHKNTEVVLTGRTAARPKKNNRRTTTSSDPTESVLHEVTPKDPSAGQWKDWVRLEDLFVIREGKDE